MQERREHVRFKAPVLIEFPHPGTMKTERSFTLDISATGLRFPTVVPFTVQQEVPLTMHLPFANATFNATGTVVWVREIARHGATQYEVGLRFHWMDDPDRQKLLHYFEGLITSRV